jgi:hypothetical protein
MQEFNNYIYETYAQPALTMPFYDTYQASCHNTNFFTSSYNTPRVSPGDLGSVNTTNYSIQAHTSGSSSNSNSSLDPILTSYQSPWTPYNLPYYQNSTNSMIWNFLNFIILNQLI